MKKNALNTIHLVGRALFMWAIVTLMFVWLIPDASALGALPAGPHTRAKLFTRDIVVQPFSERRAEIVVVPFPGTKVWTGTKSCLVNVPGDFDIDAKIRLTTWVKNMDVNEYYSLNVLDSWKGDGCSALEAFENPIHIQHNLRVTLRCANFSNEMASCRANLLLFAK